MGPKSFHFDRVKPTFFSALFVVLCVGALVGIATGPAFARPPEIPDIDDDFPILPKPGPWMVGQWDTLPYGTQLPNGTPWSAAHSAMLHTGRVILFPEGDTFATVLWDPTDLVNPVFDYPDNQPGDFLFCSGHSFLSDGRLLVAGGGGNFVSNAINEGWKFDPDAGTLGVWTQVASPMTYERWYPTLVTLGYPKVLVASGIHGPGVVQVPQMEIYNELTDSFTTVTGPPSNPGGADRVMPETYPGLHLLPNGKILYTRTGFGHFTAETGTTAAYFEFTDPVLQTTGQWIDMTTSMNFPDRTEGMSVQVLTPTSDPYEQKARIVVFGGGQPDQTGRQKAEIIDTELLSPSTPWTLLPDLEEPRFHCTAVHLPDGKVLVFGGAEHGNNGSNGSHTTELFNPATNTFAQMEDMEFARGYHVVSVLLPSGKVFVAGGVSGANETKIEIFSPPYLFRGARPTITSAPSLVHHGDTFTISTPDAGSITKVVLVRPMAFTHHTDSEQRALQLNFTVPARTSITATAPDGIHPHWHAPRGYYMLFILNSAGVPSVGQFVHLH